MLSLPQSHISQVARGTNSVETWNVRQLDYQAMNGRQLSHQATGLDHNDGQFSRAMEWLMFFLGHLAFVVSDFAVEGRKCEYSVKDILGKCWSFIYDLLSRS